MSDLPSDEYISQHEIKYAEVALKTDSKDMILVDIRRPEELKDTGFIPGSHNVPLQELDEALGLEAAAFRSRYGFDKPPTTEELIVTCRSGRRVKMSVPIFAKHGYSNLNLYLGSFLDWEQNGGRICTM